MIRRLLIAYPLPAFFILAFLISWLTCLPWLALGPSAFFIVFFVGSSGPTLAALLVTKVTEGTSGVRKLGCAITKWRVGAWAWMVALGAFPACLLTATGLYHLLRGEGIPPWHAPATAGPYLTVWQFILCLPLLAMMEEIGWRGYAWPALLQRFHPLMASIIMGALWAGWHLPLFFIPGMSHNHTPLLPYVALAMAVSACLGWLHHRTGSILLAAVFHTTLNYCGMLLGPRMAIAITFGILITCMAVVMLASMHRHWKRSVP